MILAYEEKKKIMKLQHENNKRTIENEYKRAIQLLENNKEKLMKLADILIEKEVIFKDDLETIFGKRPFETQTSYEAFTNKKVEKAPEVKEEEIVEPANEQETFAESPISASDTDSKSE